MESIFCILLMIFPPIAHYLTKLYYNASMIVPSWRDAAVCGVGWSALELTSYIDTPHELMLQGSYFHSSWMYQCRVWTYRSCHSCGHHTHAPAHALAKLFTNRGRSVAMYCVELFANETQRRTHPHRSSSSYLTKGCIIPFTHALVLRKPVYVPAKVSIL